MALQMPPSKDVRLSQPELLLGKGLRDMNSYHCSMESVVADFGSNPTVANQPPTS